ncbi:hypothetical protein Tco_0673725 [Tanacetum coccineum]
MKQMLGDHEEQYAMLWDYAIELKKINRDTTVKTQFETNTNLTLSLRVFKRIYVCLDPLKADYKAGRREILGLDEAFIKGPLLEILPAIAQLFLAVEHRFYVRRIYDNMKQLFRGRIFKDLLWKCATASTMGELNVISYLTTDVKLLTQVIEKCEGLLTPTTHGNFRIIKRESNEYNVMRFELIDMPCKHDVAEMFNMASHGKEAGIPEDWVA